MQNIPTLSDFKNYVVDRAGEPEVIWAPLYDNQLFATAGSTAMTFFSTPIGQGVTSSLGAVVGTAKTLFDTNMQLAGQLPAPQGFQIESIEVRFTPGRSATANTFLLALPSQAATVAAAAVTAQLDDVKTIAESGLVNLYIGSKFYLQDGPLGKFPPKTQFNVQGAIGNSDTTTHNEVAMLTGFVAGQPYFLEVPISLTANMNWNVAITWPGAVATPSGFNGRIGVHLNGWLFRNSQ